MEGRVWGWASLTLKVKLKVSCIKSVAKRAQTAVVCGPIELGKLGSVG